VENCVQLVSVLGHINLKEVHVRIGRKVIFPLYEFLASDCFTFCSLFALSFNLFQLRPRMTV